MLVHAGWCPAMCHQWRCRVGRHRGQSPSTELASFPTDRLCWVSGSDTVQQCQEVLPQRQDAEELSSPNFAILLLNGGFFWAENSGISRVAELVRCLWAVTHLSPLSQQCVIGLLSQDMTFSVNGLCLVAGFSRRQFLFHRCLN